MRRHDFDPLSFVLGLLVLGSGLVLVSGDGIGRFVDAVWVGPVFVLALGGALLAQTVSQARRERIEEQAAATQVAFTSPDEDPDLAEALDLVVTTTTSSDTVELPRDI